MTLLKTLLMGMGPNVCDLRFAIDKIRFSETLNLCFGLAKSDALSLGVGAKARLRDPRDLFLGSIARRPLRSSQEILSVPGYGVRKK